jgi:hypothetical protein
MPGISITALVTVVLMAMLQLNAAFRAGISVSTRTSGRAGRRCFLRTSRGDPPPRPPYQGHPTPLYSGKSPHPSSSSVPPASFASASPVKAHVFIDGSWLYYSMHGREFQQCAIAKVYGNKWHLKYRVRWEKLTQIIGREVQRQLSHMQGVDRFVDVYRTTVFSSARADTYQDSLRMRMFRAMEAQNFEVHMETTIGDQEKCIDIALAVEMLHYATVPDAYDIAILVTGDKDFMPAMARTRQKGRRVALASMRNGCNNDLTHPSAHVRDFEVIWLEDHLRDLIEIDPNSVQLAADAPLGGDEICEVVSAILTERGGFMGSRELGRMLKLISINKNGNKNGRPGENLLTLIKTYFGGLRLFLTTHATEFDITHEKGDVAFVVHLDKVSLTHCLPGSFCSLTPACPPYLQNSKSPHKLGTIVGQSNEEEDGLDLDAKLEEEFSELNLLKAVEVKEMLKERNLPTSGTKTVLLERLKQHIIEENGAAEEADGSASNEDDDDDEYEGLEGAFPPLFREGRDGSSLDPILEKLGLRMANVPKALSNGTIGAPSVEADAALVSLIASFIDSENPAVVEGPIGSSRNIGRFLSTVQLAAAGIEGMGDHDSALAFLKDNYGSLVNFITLHEEEFKMLTTSQAGHAIREFRVIRAPPKEG